MARGITLPNLGHLDYSTQRAINILRENLEDAHSVNDALVARLRGMPAPLTLDQIQAALSPTGSHPIATAALLNTTPAPTNPPIPPPFVAPAPENHDALVATVLAAQVPPLDGTSTNEQIFRFAQQVVWEISLLGPDANGSNVGLLHQDSGDGVFTCAGIPYATFRICYDNGANIKILTGSFTAQWTQEGDIPISEWRPPTAPGSPC